MKYTKLIFPQDLPLEKTTCKSFNKFTVKPEVTSPLKKTIPFFNTHNAVPCRKCKEWGREVIYFVLTDRFNDGNLNNNFDMDKGNLSQYHGGDFRGVIDKLPYLKELGVTSIWISPVVKNQIKHTDYNGKESYGYHGYWPVDFYDVASHQGTLDELKELVNKAHDKGIKVILDVVLNHTAWKHPWNRNTQMQDLYHYPQCDIDDWQDDRQILNCGLYGLPDLNQENPQVTKYLVENAKWWIDQTGIDGFRVDAVRHIPHWFWKYFSNAIHEHAGDNFVLIGENFDGRPSNVASYQRDGIDSMFDFPLYFTIKDVFCYDGNMRNLARRMAEDYNYDNSDILVAFLDNQDTNRFMTEANYHAKEKLKLALAFITTINRIPCIYYGTEVGMEGVGGITSTDRPPENRKDMDWNKDPELLNFFKRLTAVRNEHIALQNGKYLEMWQDERIFAYSRLHEQEEVIVGLNNSYQNQQRDIPIRVESGLKDGTRLVNILGLDEVVIKNGRIRVDFKPKEPKIFALKKKAQGI